MNISFFTFFYLTNSSIWLNLSIKPFIILSMEYTKSIEFEVFVFFSVSNLGFTLYLIIRFYAI